MMNNPVGWFEIHVQDLDRASAFYEKVLAGKLEHLGPPAGSGPIQMKAFPMERGAIGAGGALVKMEGVPSGGNSTLVYFMSEDCAIEAARVAGAGGKVFKEKFSIAPYGFIALAFDTEGNLFGLHSMK